MKKKKRLGYKSGTEVKNHPWFNDILWTQIENMSLESPFVFFQEDNFDDSYAQKEDNDSIYEGNKELFILEVNDSNMFKDFYFNIEDKENDVKEKDKKETKNKTNFTSKTSNKKIEEDTSIVIHSIRNGHNTKRKTAKFIGIEPNEDKKVVKVLRKENKSGSLRLNLNKIEED